MPIVNGVCRARKCMQPISAKRPMCLRHWRMVPRELRQQILGEYPHYFEGTLEAIKYVAEQEGVWHAHA